MNKMFCPYCNQTAQWCENKIIYGKNYGKSYMIWLCKKCDAYVGCHNNTRQPLGTMANQELRDWRKKTHRMLDPLWKEKSMTRKEVYQMLNKHFGYEIHIGSSDIKQCKAIVKFLNHD